MATASLTWYGPVGRTFASAANVDLGAVSGVGPEDLLYLGGLEGMRGYPNYFWVGTRRWIASFEERVFTDVELWGLFRLGFIAFTDAGAIRRLDTGDWSRTYADVGGGLRVGDLKSSLGRVVFFNAAWPLVKEPGQERWQLIFGNRVRF
jgi:hemolysin activation/secretion protein